MATKTDLLQAHLPEVGLSRWNQISLFIPVCKETWRKLALEGRAPQPQRLSTRCTTYRNEDVLRWLKDPKSFRA